METLAALAARLGHNFARPELLVEAMTHPSFANETPDSGPDNQRLEFLGDAVLQLIVTDALYTLCPTAPEGVLSRHRSILTKGQCLAQIALELGLDRALKLGRSEASTGGATRTSNLEDAFEALVGALYLDAGLEVTRATVLTAYGALEPRIASGQLTDNPKGRLQERIQARPDKIPLRYETTHSSGADHEREYTSRLWLGEELVGEGRGQSKKVAEEAAARDALTRVA